MPMLYGPRATRRDGRHGVTGSMDTDRWWCVRVIPARPAGSPTCGTAVCSVTRADFCLYCKLLMVGNWQVLPCNQPSCRFASLPAQESVRGLCNAARGCKPGCRTVGSLFTNPGLVVRMLRNQRGRCVTCNSPALGAHSEEHQGIHLVVVLTLGGWLHFGTGHKVNEGCIGTD